MTYRDKPSVSGLMSQSHEVSRFENLFYKTVNTAYYLQDWGLDWPMFLNNNYQIPLNSFLSYLTQEAMKKGIGITSLTGEIIDFTLHLNVVIDGIEYQTSTDLNIGDL